MALTVTSVRTGHVLDEVRLVDGKLAYQTGRARQIVEGKRAAHPELSDADLYRLVTDWSNGYIQISDEQDDAR